MIRLIIKRTGALPDGSLAGTTYDTFDLDNEQLEKLLKPQHTYETVSLMGAEIRSALPQPVGRT